MTVYINYGTRKDRCVCVWDEHRYLIDQVLIKHRVTSPASPFSVTDKKILAVTGMTEYLQFPYNVEINYIGTIARKGSLPYLHTLAPPHPQSIAPMRLSRRESTGTDPQPLSPSPPFLKKIKK